jgi:CSLREA domain-containing protein
MRSATKATRKRAGLTALLALSFTAAAAVGLHGRLTTTASASTTFVVNSTGDGADSNPGDGVCNDGSGNCTLRAAIQQANATSGTDTINFQIPGSGVRTIAPVTGLPAVTDPVVIDGYTQPGSSPNTLASGDDAVLLVELSGANIDTSGGTGASGLVITGGASTVRGLVINRFGLGEGISLEVTGNNVVEGNFIGTDAAGATRLGNFDGVKITSNGSPANSNNLVGGTTPAARNLISGNGVGVFIERTASSNRVQGNFIGTNAAGTAALGNTSHGVLVGTTSNTVGGPGAGERNVISGNGAAGVLVQPNVGGTASNVVSGNYIGTDAAGSAPVPNSFVGVWINQGTGNTVGGSTATSGNVISGNAGTGVLILGPGANNNQVGGNLIGTDATGTRALGNGASGIRIEGSAVNNSIQPLGPSAPPNVIAFNGTSGVTMLPSARNNPIRLNRIFSNGSLGIDLNGDGVTPNDPGDADPGANDTQNFPVITSVVSGSTTTTIQGTLDSKPSTSFSLDFFSNSGCNRFGNGEGATILGGGSATTDAGGNATFTATIPAALPAGRVVTATATDNTSGSRNTSEFSRCFATATGATGQAEFAPNSYSAVEDAGSFNVTVVRTGGSTGTLTVALTADGTATPGADYTAPPSSITFADGETSKTFSVQVVNDGVTEPQEVARFTLSDPANPDSAGGHSVFTLNILDASQLPSVSINDAGRIEPFSGSADLSFTVTLSAATGKTVSVDYTTTNNSAVAGSDFVAASGTVVFGPNELTKTIRVAILADLQPESNERFFVDLSNPVNATIADGRGVGTIVDERGQRFEFSAATYNVSEGTTAVVITVNRFMASAPAATVDYATSDGTASERSDYTTALGTLRFAQDELSKSFTVLLTDDGFQEGEETFTVTLSNPTGGHGLAEPSTAVIRVADNDAAPSTVNPINNPQLFVRQHYHDFLNREPDDAGFQFWTSQISSCGTDAGCIDVKRTNVSQAFFLSIEFQRTGYEVIRVYRASFTDSAEHPRGLPRYREFLRDTQEIQRGVVIGQPGADAQLEANRQDFARRWVQSAGFVALFPETMTAQQFVDQLFANSQVTPTQAERDAAVAAFGAGGTDGRANALLSVTDSGSVYNRQYNPAAVLMQYFGYLRRNPPDPPEATLDFAGYDFWLTKLNNHSLPGEDVRNEETARNRLLRAEMVRSFIISGEYRGRFGTN